MQIGMFSFEKTVDFLHNLLDAALRIVCRYQGQENIGRHAGQERIREAFSQDSRNPSQAIIAPLCAVHRVIMLEVRQIEVRQHISAKNSFGAISRLTLRRPGKEEMPAHESCQRIMLHCTEPHMSIDEQQ